MTDDDLLSRAREGDTAAFGELVDRHRGAVLRAAIAAIGDRDEAEDVAQDTFVAAWQALGAFRGDASVRTWLLAIAWRRALGRRRSMRRWWARWTPPADCPHGAGPDDLPSERPSQEQRVLGQEFAGAVHRVVASLGAKRRDALMLAASGEYSMDDIAGMLGVPVGTVKWRVAEARRIVRQKLARLGHA